MFYSHCARLGSSQTNKIGQDKSDFFPLPTSKSLTSELDER